MKALVTQTKQASCGIISTNDGESAFMILISCTLSSIRNKLSRQICVILSSFFKFIVSDLLTFSFRIPAEIVTLQKHNMVSKIGKITK